MRQPAVETAGEPIRRLQIDKFQKKLTHSNEIDIGRGSQQKSAEFDVVRGFKTQSLVKLTLQQA